MINLKTNFWEIKNIDTLIFDKDGTFIDLHYFWGKMTELRALEVIKHYDVDDKIFPKICLSLGYDIISGKMLKDGITALYSRSVIIKLFVQDLQKMGIPANEEDIEKIFDNISTQFYKNMEKYTKPIDEAISFIKEIRNLGIKTAIVTSDSKVSAELTLKHFGWEELFDVVIGRESSPETKESGVPVKMALDLLKSETSSTVMVGDAPMDFIAAKNAGIETTILVASGQIEKETLAKTSDFVIDSLSEVKIIHNYNLHQTFAS